jgi:hypothetical protein
MHICAYAYAHTQAYIGKKEDYAEKILSFCVCAEKEGEKEISSINKH